MKPAEQAHTVLSFILNVQIHMTVFFILLGSRGGMDTVGFCFESRLFVMNVWLFNICRIVIVIIVCVIEGCLMRCLSYNNI